MVGIAVTTRNWSALTLTELATTAYAGSQVVYGVYFRGSAVDAKLTTIGRKKTAAVSTIEVAK
jgi:hypothetical protein